MIPFPSFDTADDTADMADDTADMADKTVSRRTHLFFFYHLKMNKSHLLYAECTKRQSYNV